MSYVRRPSRRASVPSYAAPTCAPVTSSIRGACQPPNGNPTGSSSYFRRKAPRGQGRPGSHPLPSNGGCPTSSTASSSPTAAPRRRPRRLGGPGGHTGATLPSSAVNLPPDIDTSDQSHPRPAPSTLPPRQAPSTPPAASAAATQRRRTRGVKTQRPPDERS